MTHFHDDLADVGQPRPATTLRTATGAYHVLESYEEVRQMVGDAEPSEYLEFQAFTCEGEVGGEEEEAPPQITSLGGLGMVMALPVPPQPRAHHHGFVRTSLLRGAILGWEEWLPPPGRPAPEG